MDTNQFINLSVIPMDTSANYGMQFDSSAVATDLLNSSNAKNTLKS